MLILVPGWAHHYDEFWAAVKRRNLWFIKLRYLFAFSLMIFLIGGEFILDFQLTDTQVTAIAAIIITIASYNIFLHWFRKHVKCVPGQFNCLHMSLVQMLLDLFALMILIYFTGVIESPLYMFFIFQMIIGSLILPGYVVYTIAGLIIIIFSSLIILQHNSLIPSFPIEGLYSQESGFTSNYVFLFIVVFSTMLIVSVLIANRIARSLYKREQELRETLLKLNEAEVTKQKYIMGVVHEIKSPIAAVKSIIDLILQNFLGPVSDQISVKLKRAHQRTDDALNLINNILRISKLRILNITTTEELNIAEMIQSTISKNSDTAVVKNLEIKFSDTRKENKPLKGDRVLLELAMSNMLSNAIKYNMDNGIIEITLNDHENELEIEFCDSGIGIPAKDTEKIFAQFYRASNLKWNDFEGSGVGLALVMEIIERHNGQIKVESPSRLSTPDRPGTSFTIRMPYQSKITSK